MTDIIYGAEAIDWIENNIKNLRKMLSDALKEQERIEQSNIDYLTKRFPVDSMAQVKDEYFDYWRSKIGKPILSQYGLVCIVSLDSRGLTVSENGVCERMDIGMAANVLHSLNEENIMRAKQAQESEGHHCQCLTCGELYWSEDVHQCG